MSTPQSPGPDPQRPGGSEPEPFPASYPEAPYQRAAYPQASYPPVPGPAQPAPAKRSPARSVLGLLLALAVLGVAAFFALTQFNVNTTAVGDCLVDDGQDSVQKVGCDDPRAQYQVIQILEKQLEPTDVSNPCQDNPDATRSYWEGARGGTGRLLCLADV